MNINKDQIELTGSLEFLIDWLLSYDCSDWAMHFHYWLVRWPVSYFSKYHQLVSLWWNGSLTLRKKESPFAWGAFGSLSNLERHDCQMLTAPFLSSWQSTCSAGLCCCYCVRFDVLRLNWTHHGHFYLWAGVQFRCHHACCQRAIPWSV